jgi:hypothetical protein
VVEERERRLLLEMRLRRRRDAHAVVPRGVHHELLLRNVEQIEQLEVAVEHVDLRFASVLAAREQRLLGEHDVLRAAHDRFRGAERVHAAREPRQLGAVVARLLAHHDRDGGMGHRHEGRHRRGEREGHAVLPADGVGAELAVRRGERAGEAHAARDAVELARDVAVLGEDQVGTDDARDVLFEAVLPSELHDLLGLAAVQLLGDVRRCGSARAPQV